MFDGVLNTSLDVSNHGNSAEKNVLKNITTLSDHLFLAAFDVNKINKTILLKLVLAKIRKQVEIIGRSYT